MDVLKFLDEADLSDNEQAAIFQILHSKSIRKCVVEFDLTLERRTLGTQSENTTFACVLNNAASNFMSIAPTALTNAIPVVMKDGQFQQFQFQSVYAPPYYFPPVLIRPGPGGMIASFSPQISASTITNASFAQTYLANSPRAAPYMVIAPSFDNVHQPPMQQAENNDIRREIPIVDASSVANAPNYAAPSMGDQISNFSAPTSNAAEESIVADASIEAQQIEQQTEERMISTNADSVLNSTTECVLNRTTADDVSTNAIVQPKDQIDSIDQIAVSPESAAIATETNADLKENELATSIDIEKQAPSISAQQNILIEEVPKSIIAPAKEEPAKPKSWASLLHGTAAAKKAIVMTVAAKNYEPEIDEDVALQRAIAESARETSGREGEKKDTLENMQETTDISVPVERDQVAKYLAHIIKNSSIPNRGPTYAIRGFLNRGNWCYVNATLQALMACPPFFQFLRNASRHRQRSPSSTPLLDAFTRLVSEFALVKDLANTSTHASSNRSYNESAPLEPIYMHSIIKQLKTDASFKGRQEDAEEFLLLVLNRLHEEIVAILALLDTENTGQQSPGSITGNGIEEPAEAVGNNCDWQQVVSSRKTVVTRPVKKAYSPIADIFCGQLWCGLLQPGAKESASLEPFFTLPLEVQSNAVQDISSALVAFTSKETLKNFQGVNKTEVDAVRRILFYELPRVLIFQLKYFVYTDETSKKIAKKIGYQMDLHIEKELISPGSPAWTAVNQRHYKLFAVVFHHGEKADGGHYTVDVFQGGRWTHIDDTKMAPVKNEHVLSFQTPRVPYLLFYRRMDPNLEHSQQHRQTSGTHY